TSFDFLYLNERPVIVNADNSIGQIKLSRFDGENWIEESIDSCVSCGAISMTHCGKNEICLAYIVDNTLKVARGRPGTQFTTESALIPNEGELLSEVDIAIQQNQYPIVIISKMVNHDDNTQVEYASVLAKNVDGSWSEDYTSYQGRGDKPAIAVDGIGTIHAAFGTLSNYGVGLTYIQKKLGETWISGGPSVSYQAKPPAFLVVEDGIRFAYVRRMTSALFGRQTSVNISYPKTLEDGYQQWPTWYFHNSNWTLPSFSYLNLLKDAWGNLALIYRYAVGGTEYANTYRALLKADQDYDGVPDALEEKYRTQQDQQDSDNDGISDGQEILETNSSPLDADSDRDGIIDGNDLDPLNSVSDTVVIDGSMERSDSTAWVLQGSPVELRKVTDLKVQGARALYIMANDSAPASYSGVTTKWIDLSSGIDLYLEISYQRIAGGIALGVLGNSNASQIALHSFQDTSSAGWQTYRTSLKVPAGVEHVRLSLTTNQEALFDHVLLVPVEASSDFDSDGVGNIDDNCPFVSNLDQANHDQDSEGDLCDLDDDNDGVLDQLDCAPLDGSLWHNLAYSDIDGDTVRNSAELFSISCFGEQLPVGYTLAVSNLDNCPEIANPQQENSDDDSAGNACDSDDDNDGYLDEVDCDPTNYYLNTWTNAYPDPDYDGIANSPLEPACGFNSEIPSGYTSNAGPPFDNCPQMWNQDQSDRDHDSIGDACDNLPDIPNAPTPTPTPSPTPGEWNISGRVVNQSGESIQAAKLTLILTDEQRYFTVSDPAGKFSFNNILGPIGYTLHANASGHSAQQIAGTLSKDTDLVISLTLQECLLKIKAISPDAKPLAGLNLNLDQLGTHLVDQQGYVSLPIAWGTDYSLVPSAPAKNFQNTMQGKILGDTTRVIVGYPTW
ncbi:MAG: thrombospondin type 3 repeat-containing protein, partial [Bdellovibrionales bacterium]|nr:thrombospondin type 3 repeat-containing protein [Bdellovibrionales bacterium]